jgi:hypothetical protein
MAVSMTMSRVRGRVLAVALASALCASFAAPAGAQVAAPDGAVEVVSNSPMLPDTMETPRGLAMGLGARASATSTSGLAYNAAGMSIGRLYHVEEAIGYNPQAGTFQTSSGLVDSFSGPVNAGVNFRYVHGNGRNGHGGYDGRVALALPLGDNFAIGLTGRYMSFWREGVQEGEAQPVYAEQITFDASIRITPVPGLHIAALGYNLVDVGSPLVPMQVGGSISYTFESMFTLAFDGLADLSTWHNLDGTIRPEALIGGAAEFFTGEVPIRAGYIFDSGRGLHYITAGGGWMNNEIGIELSVRQQVTGPLDTNLMASFRYLIH